MDPGFINKVSDEAAKSLFQLSWSLLSDLGKKTIDNVKVRKALSNYAENYFRRNGEIKILGMHKPMPLNQIYTNVNFVPPYLEYKYRDIDDLEIVFKANRGDYGNNKDKENAFKVVNQYNKLNVLGAPGSGKSTLLKKIGLNVLLTDKISSQDPNKYIHECLPVFIELKKFRNETIDIKASIQSEFEIADFPESRHFVDNALKEGKLLILLDGLDEVPNERLELAIEQIKDFTDKYPNNRYITSCRTALYKNFIKGYTDIEISSFDNEQITCFISNWFSHEKDLAVNTDKTFLSQLFDVKNVATVELARTPLLLTFLCLTYDDGQQFPANRSSLYRKAMEILLEKWAAEKRIHQDDIYQGLNSDIEIEMLSEIAAFFYEKERTFFYSQEVKEIIKSFLENTLEGKLPPISKILEAIEVQQGLLVQRASDIYSFSHLTIQEYLTAFYYYSPKRTSRLIENYIFEPKWREVFLLQAGMPKSSDLIIMMVDFLKAYVEKNSVLKESIKWVNKSVKTTNIELDVCKRIFILSLLLRFKRDREESYPTPKTARLESYARSLITALEPEFLDKYELPRQITKQNAPRFFEMFLDITENNARYINAKKEINSLVTDKPSYKMPPGSRFAFNRQVLLVVYKALKVPGNLGMMRINQYEPIIKYLEAFQLIIECKKASLRTSPQTWKYVLDNIVH
jgi:predicted NACHT family NTPase